MCTPRNLTKVSMTSKSGILKDGKKEHEIQYTSVPYRNAEF